MGQAVKKEIEFTDEQLAEFEEVFSSFELFCETYLMIETLGGNVIPFKLNTPQKRFIKTIMDQWKSEGWIKVVIAKARKMGFTTVISAFIFWVLYTNIIDSDTRRAIAGTHKEDTNPVLLRIIRTFHNNLPEIMKLPLGKDNESVIEFPSIGAAYETKVASNTEKVGRALTGQMLHVSEIAHIDNAYGLAASLLSVVGINVQDSMVFYESTSNGMGNYHYDVFYDAITQKPGQDFIAFFAPWFEDERYQKDVPEGFALTNDERTEKKKHNLTDRQMAWRRSMMSNFKGTPKQALALFKQEYPATWQESFQFSATDSYLEADLVIDAMNRPAYPSYGPIIAAFDPSFKGKDRDAFILRQGSNVWGLELPRFGEDFDARVAFLKRKLDNKVLNIHTLFIDAGGGGIAIASRLNNDGYRGRVTVIDSGTLADDQSKAHRKRSEMFVTTNEGLVSKHEPFSFNIDPEHKDAFLQDLTATGYKLDDVNRPQMESKEHMRSRGVRSTDIADALNLTGAQRVIENTGTQRNVVANGHTDPLGNIRS